MRTVFSCTVYGNTEQEIEENAREKITEFFGPEFEYWDLVEIYISPNTEVLVINKVPKYEAEVQVRTPYP